MPLHPVRHRLSVVTIYLCVFNSFCLTLADSRAMKILLPISETQAYCFDMATKANLSSTGQFLSLKWAIAVNTGKIFHQ